MAGQAPAAQPYVVGQQHLDTLRSLSASLAALGHEVEALGLARQALAAQQRVLGPEHPDTLRSMTSLCALLAELGHHQPQLVVVQTCRGR